MTASGRPAVSGDGDLSRLRAIASAALETGNIYLVGPMGAGKSTIGRQLADLLHKEFRDADHEIEARTGASISLIFEIEGEAGFRRREAVLIAELASGRNRVVATGGGVVLDDANRRALHGSGVVVYLHAPIETLLERTQRDRSRPLLQQVDRRAKLDEIMRIREPLYRETAHLIVNTAQRPAQAVAREIIAKLEKLRAHANPRR